MSEHARAEKWRHFATCVNMLADAIEEGDPIAGLLSSRGVAYAAADLGEEIWKILHGEVEEVKQAEAADSEWNKEIWKETSGPC